MLKFSFVETSEEGQHCLQTCLYQHDETVPVNCSTSQPQAGLAASVTEVSPAKWLPLTTSPLWRPKQLKSAPEKGHTLIKWSSGLLFPLHRSYLYARVISFFKFFKNSYEVFEVKSHDLRPQSFLVSKMKTKNTQNFWENVFKIKEKSENHYICHSGTTATYWDNKILTVQFKMRKFYL